MANGHLFNQIKEELLNRFTMIVRDRFCRCLAQNHIPSPPLSVLRVVQ
jgi:hypothetical protein